MPRFVARPVIIDAYCFEGDVALWPEAFRFAVLRHLSGGITEIRTNDGPRHCCAGDWVMRGPDGTFSVVRDATFEAMFGPIEAVSPALPTHGRLLAEWDDLPDDAGLLADAPSETPPKRSSPKRA